MTDKEKVNLAITTLKNILNSCVHPDTAVRAVMVDLKPIRKAIIELEKND